MITIELSAEELELIIDQLRRSQSDLQTEIADTDARAFKAGLKVDRTKARALLARLQQSAQATSRA